MDFDPFNTPPEGIAGAMTVYHIFPMPISPMVSNLPYHESCFYS